MQSHSVEAHKITRVKEVASEPKDDKWTDWQYMYTQIYLI